MDDRSTRAPVKLVDSSASSALDLVAEQSDPRVVHADIVPCEPDPVLQAIEAAPWVHLSDEEQAQLDEIERNTSRWIPYDEFVSELETSSVS